MSRNSLLETGAISEWQLNDLASLAKCYIVYMLITYSQMYHTDKFSEHSWIIWSVWLNGSVFAYELCGCKFDTRCCQISFIVCQDAICKCLILFKGNYGQAGQVLIEQLLPYLAIHLEIWHFRSSHRRSSIKRCS